ncbi:MAG: flagellar assembly protein FliW [Brockia lithotrophica]|nr:flagellar assembly protein FliW [Brockia lithotrophica]MBT9253633.1 flagellar assembly protein FliW [Brockia lithotrophica]
MHAWLGTYEFPHGLPGFPTWTRWRLEFLEAPFFLLVAEADERIALPLIAPELVVNPYHLHVSPEAWAYAFGDPPRPEDVLVLVVVAVRNPVATSTVNLLAPIVFDVRRRQAAQILQESGEYPLRALLFREEDGRARPLAQGR